MRRMLCRLSRNLQKVFWIEGGREENKRVMGFLSYNMNFYGNELKRLEDISPSPDSIYCARRLLRMLDDLADEGYNELSELLEKELHGVSRLHEYLRSNGAAPFRAGGCLPDASGLSYSERETELSLAVSRAMLEADKLTDVHGIPFADRLKSFCRWIGYSSGTAYIFLLRDTLLPFVHYLGRGRSGVYPWLLGRKSFAELTGKRNADDEIRASVYRALEVGTMKNYGKDLQDDSVGISYSTNSPSFGGLLVILILFCLCQKILLMSNPRSDIRSSKT